MLSSAVAASQPPSAWKVRVPPIQMISCPTTANYSGNREPKCCDTLESAATKEAHDFLLTYTSIVQFSTCSVAVETLSLPRNALSLCGTVTLCASLVYVSWLATLYGSLVTLYFPIYKSKDIQIWKQVYRSIIVVQVCFLLTCYNFWRMQNNCVI